MKKKHPDRPHLAAWRRHFDITLQELANKLGTTHTSVMRWEKGESGVDDKTFAAIAEAYGITVAELSAPPTDAAAAREMHRLMTAMQRLKSGDLAVLADLAEKLAAPPRER